MLDTHGTHIPAAVHQYSMVQIIWRGVHRSLAASPQELHLYRQKILDWNMLEGFGLGFSAFWHGSL